MNETDSTSRTALSTNGETPPAPDTAATPSTMSDTVAQAPAPFRRQRIRLMRTPGFAPSAPISGLFAAWGAAAVATYALAQAGVSLAVGFGLADGRGIGNTNGFWSGLWMLLVEAGAFIIGGYTAARMARNHAMAHAGLVWVLAMATTLADALVQRVRTGGSSVLHQIGMPSWSETGLQNNWRLWLVLAVFALAALIGALVGGALGAMANRAAVVEIEPTRGGLPRSEVAPPA
jgi:hypothetical protein